MPDPIEDPIDPEVPPEPEGPVNTPLDPQILIEPFGLIEPRNNDNSGFAFYASPFGQVAVAEDYKFDQNHDIGQKTIGYPVPNELFLLRDRAAYPPVKGTIDSNGLLGNFNYSEAEYQELENVVQESDGFDRNVSIPSPYTKMNAWGE